MSVFVDGAREQVGEANFEIGTGGGRQDEGRTHVRRRWRR